MTDQHELAAILRRSVEFYDALHVTLADAKIDDSAHTWLTVSTSQVAIEHGISICMLVEAGHLTSGHALFRTQFEATVRALWLCFAATDEWLDRYMTAVETNPAKDPNCSPGMDEMLKGIAQNAPPVIAPQLMELKQGIWGHLNSFVHTGVHPAALRLTGYSLETALDAIRNANGLSSQGAMVIATVTDDEPLASRIRDLQFAHLDCLPTIVPNANSAPP
jgi:hypothetical protein